MTQRRLFPGHVGWRWAFWLCTLAVLVISLMPTVPHMPSTGWDKSNHLLGFAVLAGLGCLAWPERRARVLGGCGARSR